MKFELASNALSRLKLNKNAENWTEDRNEIITYEEWFPTYFLTELRLWFGQQFRKEQDRLFLDSTCRIKFHDQQSRAIKRQFIINKYSCIKISEMEAYFGTTKMDFDTDTYNIKPVSEPIQSPEVTQLAAHDQRCWSSQQVALQPELLYYTRYQ